jgi:hypothetical protein
MLINGPWPGSGCARWLSSGPGAYDLGLGDRTLARLAVGGGNRIAARAEATGCELVFVGEDPSGERIWATQVSPGGECLLTAGFRRQASDHDGTLTLLAGGRLTWRRGTTGGHALLDHSGRRLLHVRPDGTVSGDDLDLGAPRMSGTTLLLASLGWLLVVTAGRTAPPRRTA